MIQKIKNFYHFLGAVSANLVYGKPSASLRVIGVTGTDGKTTTTHLIYHILTQAGKKVSMVSTVYAKIGTREYDTGLHTTTPSSFEIQKLLKAAVTERAEYFVLETTSHAIDQYRVWGVQYDTSVLTNITHEHLDYHGTYENYLRTKAKLFYHSKHSILNKDDQSYRLISKLLHSRNIIFKTYGLQSDADFMFDFKKTYRKDIAGYNNYNYLAAYSVCSVLGIQEEVIVQALKTFKLPIGRMDIVYDKDFKVIVDFAHTPNSVEQLLSTVKGHMKKGKLIHIFGSAGLRDVSKRPLMGEASAKYADRIILTEEDYRTENVHTICKEIASGIQKVPCEIIVNREEAIKKAITTAQKGDVIVITGKGHERSLARGSREYPWNEQELITKILRLR